MPRSDHAFAPCVLRDALLRSAPQDEDDLCVILRANPHPEEAAERPSRRTHRPLFEALDQ